jgi:transcriptional regulator with XRE-family HTH domain
MGLKTARQRAQLTQKQLARFSGVSVRTIVSLETQTVRQPQYPTQKALCRALGVDWHNRSLVFGGTQ